MKSTAIACAVLAGALGASSLAVAQDGRHGGRDGDRSQRWEQRRDEQRSQRREEWRSERRDEWRDQNRQARRDWRQAQPQYAVPNDRYDTPRYDTPRYYAGPSTRWARGGYLPHEYRQRSYYVNNWNAYPQLYSPPYGYQWVNVDGDFLLIALATGLIANLMVN